MNERPISPPQKVWPYLATFSSASVMILAFFIPSIQDQWDRYHSRLVIGQYISLGDEFMEEERYDMAEKAYEKAFTLSLQTRLELEMKRLKARVHRMSMLVDWGAKPPEDLEEVDFQLLLHLQKGQENEKERAYTLNSYASFLAGSKKLKEAEAALQEALRIEPASPMLHLNLGNLQDQAGRKKDALKSYLKTIQLDPKSLNAHYNLGLLYAELGKNKEAQQAFEAALTLAPDDRDTRKQLELVRKTLSAPPAVPPPVITPPVSPPPVSPPPVSPPPVSTPPVSPPPVSTPPASTPPASTPPASTPPVSPPPVSPPPVSPPPVSPPPVSPPPASTPPVSPPPVSPPPASTPPAGR
jgi:tetratricopeptide (TPR) repeat protein